jgi:hypothetical protein
MAELPESDATPETIYHRLSATRRRGKAQILTFVSEDIQLTRCVIATAYALGSHVLVPWDVYLKSTPEGSVRYFGRPEDFADLYGFVRACAEFLDGYEEAAVGSLTALTEESVCPVVVESRSGRIFAALRAKPGSPHAAVAVHVVDWSGDGDSALVRIDRGSLPMREPVRAALLVPPRYVAETHREAESSGAYQSLKHEVAVAVRRVGNDLECSLPPLSPWGILLLKGSGVGED